SVTRYDQGPFRCHVFSPVSDGTSDPVNILIIYLVEFNSSVSLSCSSSGSFPSFLWLNGSSEVTASGRVQLTDGGATLTIINVARYDQGPFSCHVFNNFSNYTSDPVKLSISCELLPYSTCSILFPSQQHYEEGSNISLRCSAVSRPAALYYWFLNGDKLSESGPELRLMNLQESQSGNYSCQAFNNKTMINETSHPSVSVLLHLWILPLFSLAERQL
uniref:Ig-like domain-containing protein n=1 Tax=Seriola dumerili TaxID=41447 RepID=A0A3B4T3P2_SERDU